MRSPVEGGGAAADFGPFGTGQAEGWETRPRARVAVSIQQEAAAGRVGGWSVAGQGMRRGQHRKGKAHKRAGQEIVAAGSGLVPNHRQQPDHTEPAAAAGVAARPATARGAANSHP